ncbi:MAG TPA: molecular chaperone DnaJ [Opitutaceae bacterium]|nr:molecular chaperone DnaJ [Opitutaceae bacterium]
MRSQQFEALVRANPKNELYRFSLAQALELEGRGAEAIPHYEWCCARKSDWMVPRILLGKLLIAAGRRDGAKVVLREALALAVEQQHEDPESEVRGLLADLG